MTQEATYRIRSREAFIEQFQALRQRTEDLAGPITPEDAQVQSMDDVSPTKWHLGHTSWFFETFLLAQDPDYQAFNPDFRVLFNSYYNAVGEQHPRPRRGMLSRPSLTEVLDYRHRVTERSAALLERVPDEELEELSSIVTVGVHHEKQHQELMLTDVLHVFYSNPLRPAYTESTPPIASSCPLQFLRYDEGLQWIGAEEGSFAFDNEYPRHRQFIHAFELANRPVTIGEFLEFVEDGGYRKPEYWLSDGFQTVTQEGWTAPMYWEREAGGYSRMTLHGMLPLDLNAPMSHLSFYEADAYARYRGCRLPTEAEWEFATADKDIEGNLQESRCFVPTGIPDSVQSTNDLLQVFGDVWEWTASAYLGYPGYEIRPGALGEYNGKFMCNQFVLKGGSVATPQDHIRASYRNFFPPAARWQFMGLRLARDV